MRKRTLYSLLAVFALVLALGVLLLLRFHAPPEVARLLPESDAIVYFDVKPVRAATHFDQKPVAASAEYARFLQGTGFRWERDLDRIAVALHRMPDPNGPNGAVAYSGVLEGRFDSAKLTAWLASQARQQETYAGHTIYIVPAESGRLMRVAPLGFDLLALSNMPTTEQIHSMLDRFAAGASPFAGSSVLAAHYHAVPYFALAWGIGHIGLPFSERGRIQVFGIGLPLAEDTDLIASVTFRGDLHLRVEELAPGELAAQQTATNLTTLVNLMRGFMPTGGDENQRAVRRVIDSLQVEQQKTHVVLSGNIPVALLRASTTTP